MPPLALSAGTPAEVAALYTTDATLLPTVSNVPRTTRDGIEDYFVT